MPRQARSIFANIPHHIIQRGDRNCDVFFKKSGSALFFGIETHKHYDNYQNLIHLSQENAHYYQYDNANRLTQTTDALGNISTQDYDNFGNTISATQALGTSAEVTTYFNYGNNIYRTYNALNQMISSKQTTYTYDTNGNLTTLTQPNSTQISHIYDSLNRKTQVNNTLAQTSIMINFPA
ncbi:RHS repeat protein [Bathymodiolus thermophilus thioautotrophic gill symbiont]|uniref:Teneurin-like YD-shell domain-containing protein n=1 Tax=Bathymodiolus thermophilus thioautotrophic gill symbiont TaxID=2360 RepID=A0A1J5U8X9_9GAMM|nr:RHS repeat protein [Bathymodiolus thermophilus thioautotrophic gill symbiont]OIR25294.1 hypothetical protein BGC33_06090 [Bathymodiolus thermophilus thioautotrophic gill symbiont]